MPILAVKQILGAVAFACFAIKWAFDWKTDGWFSHSFTVGSAIMAALSLAFAISVIASICWMDFHNALQAAEGCGSSLTETEGSLIK